jgi:hypothetical protein
MTLPGANLEEELSRRNAAIAAVMAYSKVEEGGPRRGGGHPCQTPAMTNSSVKERQEAAHPTAPASSERKSLDDAILSVFREKRPRKCFVCLGNRMLDLNMRVRSFASPGDLSKHFRRRSSAASVICR